MIVGASPPVRGGPRRQPEQGRSHEGRMPQVRDEAGQAGRVGIGLRGTAAGGVVRQGRLQGARLRTAAGEGRGHQPRRELHHRRADGGAGGGGQGRPAGGDDRLLAPGRGRQREHLRADAAGQDAGSGHLATSSPRSTPSRRACTRACWSSSRAPPTRARPRRSSCRSSRPSGLEVGKDFFLAFSPERVDPGNPELPHREHPQGRRRRDAGLHRGGHGPLQRR